MAKDNDIAAIRKCQLREMLIFPRNFINPIYAVIKKEDNVISPKYIIRGLPKIK